MTQKSNSLVQLLREIFKTSILDLTKELSQKSDIENLSNQVEQKLSSREISIKIPDRIHGDFTTTIALELAKIFKNNPLAIAEQIKDKVLSLTKKKQIFQTIECVKPGYLNLTLTDSFRQSFIIDILKNFSDYAKAQNQPKEKILLEYVSANPTGPLHIGHGRWAVIGSVLKNILKHYGFSVENEFYINDVGNQINNFTASVRAVREDKPIPEDGYHGEYLERFKNNDKDPVKTMLENHKTSLAEMNTHFDNFFSEKTLHKQNKITEVIDLLKEKNFLFYDDKALVFRTTDFGDDKDRVLIKSDGSYTYFAVDIAYHYDKVKRGYDTLINILGADHHGYVNRLHAAVKVLSKAQSKVSNQDKAIKLNIIIGQLVTLLRDGKPVRMSKRQGNVVYLSEVSKDIGSDALRYFLSMKGHNTALDFDLDLAKKKSNENPIFYVQYAHARLNSIFEKAKNKGIPMIPIEEFNFSKISDFDSRVILNKIFYLPEEIKMITVSYEIHHLTQYLYDLSTLFHSYYNKVIFVNEEERELSEQYLFFLKLLKKVMRLCFELLGITPLDKM